MKNMKKIISIFVLALCILPFTAQAQTYEEVYPDTVVGLRHYQSGDNWFFGLHGGINNASGENIRLGRDFGDVFGWTAAASLGKYFSPQVGARLQAGYMTQHGIANEEFARYHHLTGDDAHYDFHNIFGYIDGLLNFNNIFAKFKESTKLNVIGIAGIGVNYTGGFSDNIKSWRHSPSNGVGYNVRPDSKAYFAMRAGLGLNWFISKSVDLGLEVTYNAVDDGYNGVRDDKKNDGYFNALLGLTFHFKDQYGDYRFKYRSLNDADMIDELNRKINAARADLAGIRPDTKTEGTQTRILDMTVSFIIDKYNITDIQKKNVEAVANYIKTHDDVNVVVTGYADVQTAYPAYNMKLSERRAKAVYNMLVNEFGVDPDRLRMDYKGDTVQPYERKNEWNRVVVFILEPRNR